MNTDTLIDILATDVSPVKPALLRNELIAVLAAGAGTALGAMLTLFGVPAHAFAEPFIGVRVATLAVMVAFIIAGSMSLLEVARPGAPRTLPLIGMGVLLAVLLCAGIGTLLLTSPADRGQMLFGPQWTQCLERFPVLALPPIVMLVWFVRRRTAPTRLRLSGAIIGALAASLGVGMLACCVPAISPPLIALGYGGLIVLSAAAGALLGPRLLRW